MIKVNRFPSYISRALAVVCPASVAGSGLTVTPLAEPVTLHFTADPLAIPASRNGD